MGRKRLEIIITLVLVIVFILAWANSIRVLKERNKRNVPVQVPNAFVTPEAANSGTLTEANINNGKTNLEWNRCPFSGKNYGSIESKSINLKLNGIIWDDKKPVAVINNDIVKSGDKLSNNIVVVEIKKDRVILNDGSKNIELKLE